MSLPLNKVATDVYPSSPLREASSTTRTTLVTEFDEHDFYPLKQENTAGQEDTYSYSQHHGAVHKKTSANGGYVNTIYDFQGRSIRRIDDSGVVTETQRLYCDNSPSFIDCPEGAYFFEWRQIRRSNTLMAPTEIRYFDATERVLRTESMLEQDKFRAVDVEYDKLGRVKKRSLPFMRSEGPEAWIEYDYDILNRPKSTTHPAGQKVQFRYEADGNLIKTIKTTSYANVNKTETSWRNGIDELSKTSDAQGLVTRYKYNAASQLMQTETGNDSSTRIRIYHDSAGNKTRIVDPSAGEIAFKYNGFGELRAQIWAPDHAQNEKRMEIIYDDLGRQKSRIDYAADGSYTLNDWLWDTRKIGMLSRKSSNNGFKEEYYYDSKRRLSRRATHIDGALRADFRYRYDAMGRLKQTDYPTGLTTENRYNGVGELVQIDDVSSSRKMLWAQGKHLDDRGNRTKVLFGNGVVTQDEYNGIGGWLNSRKSGRVTSRYTQGQNPDVQNLEYQYDPLGRLKSRESELYSVAGTKLETAKESFVYDSMDRLKSAQSLNVKTRYEYDSNGYGNLINSWDAAKSKPANHRYDKTGNASVYAVTSAKGASYHYDVYGNLSRKAGKFKDTRFAHNVFNKPTQIGNTSFAYGPDQMRFKQAKRYIKTYYVGGGEYEELHAGPHVAKKVYVAGILVHSVKSGSKSMRYLHRDHLGSIEAITNERGLLVERLSFDAFGQRRKRNHQPGRPTTALPTTRGYTSHEHLDDDQLIHMNGRVYDPAVGRFLSADLFVQAPGYSQSYNRYSYVFNNPLKYTDPTGYLSSNILEPTFQVNGKSVLRDTYDAYAAGYYDSNTPVLVAFSRAQLMRVYIDAAASGVSGKQQIPCGENSCVVTQGRRLNRPRMHVAAARLGYAHRARSAVADGETWGGVDWGGIFGDLAKLGKRLNTFSIAVGFPRSQQQMHRGRIQAQGGGLEESVAWSQLKPPTSAEGLVMVDALKTQLTTKQINARAIGFSQAERFINNAGNAGGVSAPVSRSFPRGNVIRVDIEVITGEAFVP